MAFEAFATARVRMAASTMRLLLDGKTPKGDVLAVARVAGIQAAKRTPDIIPLCHHVALSGCTVTFDAERPPEGAADALLNIETCARAVDRTGVEMEALCAASVAALTIYDMLKAVDRAMVVEAVSLQQKRGGKSGDFVRAPEAR